jgi:hypothetical protein
MNILPFECWTYDTPKSSNEGLMWSKKLQIFSKEKS